MGTPGFIPVDDATPKGFTPIAQEPQLPQNPIPENYGFTFGNFGKNLWGGLKGVAQSSAELGKDVLTATDPQKIKGVYSKYVDQPAAAEAQKATDLWGQGRKWEAAGHELAGALPMVGPWAAQLGEQAGTGDVGGATGQAVGAAAGGYALGKGIKATANTPKLIEDFVRRAKSMSDVTEAAAGHYKQAVQPPIQSLKAAIQNEGAKTISQAIEADKAAQTVQGRGTISAAPAIVEASKAIEETGHLPSGPTRALLSRLSAQSLMTLEDAKNLRSDFGSAASRADVAGNAKLGKILWGAYDELGNGMADRVQELSGSRAPFDHYNNEFKAYYELNKGVAGEMQKSIMDRHEAVPQLKKFADADLTEIKTQMKKYGLDAKALDKAQTDARALVSASDAIGGKVKQGAYRLILQGGSGALAVAAVYAAAHGAGLYGMVPLAMASYAGSKVRGVPEQMVAGEILRRLRMEPNASQIRTLVQGPMQFEYSGPESDTTWNKATQEPAEPSAGEKAEAIRKTKRRGSASGARP